MPCRVPIGTGVLGSLKNFQVSAAYNVPATREDPMLHAVTCDIDRLHAEVRARCLRAGFTDRVGHGDGTVRRLPGTTLVVRAAGCSDAARMFMREAAKVSGTVTVLRLVSFEYGTLYQLSDHECQPDPSAAGRDQRRHLAHRNGIREAHR